jgi:hypothetical protein
VNSRNTTIDQNPGTFKVLEINVPIEDGMPKEKKEKISDGLIRAVELGMKTLDSAFNAIVNSNTKTINAFYA